MFGQQNNRDERAASTHTFDYPDLGFLPRDLHSDSDESNIVDGDALSTTDDAEESDSRRNSFIDDDDAIEEANRLDDEANDEDGCDDDDCDGGGGDDEQADENDLKFSSFPRSKRRRLTTLLDSHWVQE